MELLRFYINKHSIKNILLDQYNKQIIVRLFFAILSKMIDLFLDTQDAFVFANHTRSINCLFDIFWVRLLFASDKSDLLITR